MIFWGLGILVDANSWKWYENKNGLLHFFDAVIMMRIIFWVGWMYQLTTEICVINDISFNGTEWSETQ